MRIVLILLASIAVSSCASRATVDTLDHSRTFSNERQASVEARLNELRRESESREFMNRVDYPLLSGVEVSSNTTLPSVFEEEWSFYPQWDVRLIDAVKPIQAEFDLTVSISDDVYNPAGSELNNDSDEAATVEVLNQIRTEGNLVKEARIQLPAGSNYKGDLAGFFDHISSLLGIDWEYIPEESKVVLRRYIQRSYPVLVAADSPLWNSAAETITEFKSEGGGVKANPDVGLISVIDTADVHKMAKKLIDQINASAKLGALFRVEIVSVRFSDDDAAAFGINLSNSAGSRQVSFTTPVSSIPGAGGLTGTVLTGTPFTGSQLVAQSLSSKSEITSSQVKTVFAANNTTASISQVTTIPLLTQYTPPVITDSATVPASASLEKQDVGFEMALTPSIHTNGSALAVNMDISNSEIINIEEIKLNDNGQFLQSAQVAKSDFNSRLVMKNKETLIFAIEDDRAQFKSIRTSNAPWYGWILNLLGSGSNDSATKDYFVVAITPTVDAGAKL